MSLLMTYSGTSVIAMVHNRANRIVDDQKLITYNTGSCYIVLLGDLSKYTDLPLQRSMNSAELGRSIESTHPRKAYLGRSSLDELKFVGTGMNLEEDCILSGNLDSNVSLL